MTTNVVTLETSYLIIRQKIRIWKMGHEELQRERMDLIKYHVTVQCMQTMTYHVLSYI